MSINPDLRNQHTTLDAERAKNPITGHCERCGSAFSSRTGRKKFCSPCSALNQEEYARAYQKRIYKPKARKLDACLDCGCYFKVRGGKQVRCSSCAFKINMERNRIRAARRVGARYRLTDLEIPQAQELQRLGSRTDEIAKEMDLPEAAVANSLWAEKFGEEDAA